MPITRRQFCALSAGTLASLPFGSACDAATYVDQRITAGARLAVAPKAGVKTTARGLTVLGVGAGRDGILAMPSKVPDGPMPLIVMLHGAGGSADRFLPRFNSLPDEAGVAALFLDSRGQTWDAIRGGFGPDTVFLNSALANVFDRVAVDPARLAIGGFSDGATYALSLGLANGDLFTRIVAWSPGFIVDAEPHGKPKIFVSHGTADDILPIDRCSRVFVPVLKKRGYDVTFREFEGPHTVPADVAAEGLRFAAKV